MLMIVNNYNNINTIKKIKLAIILKAKNKNYRNKQQISIINIFIVLNY